MMVYSPLVNAFRQSAEEASGVPNFMDALRQGLQGAADVYKPKQASEALLAQMLQNKFNTPRANRADEFAEAELKYKKALAKQALQGLNPFNRLSGPARDAYSIEMLKNQLGDSSPTYLSAKAKYDLDQESQRGLNDYRRGLADTILKRTSSPLGKLSQEEEDVVAGFEPNTNRQHQISPERQQDLLGQYQLAKQKSVTDTDTRKKNLLATNIEKTKESIDPNKLVYFASPAGLATLKKEQIKAMLNPGTESQEYKDYLEMESKAKFLAHQVRQFYGDSIQPSVLKEIEQITNPATWKNNPEIALKLFNSFSDLVGKEMQTYRSALKNTKVYQGEENAPAIIEYVRDENGRIVPAKRGA